MGIGCVSISVHKSLSYSEGIMPDYGAKQGALSLCWYLERTLAGLNTQLFLAALH